MKSTNTGRRYGLLLCLLMLCALPPQLDHRSVSFVLQGLIFNTSEGFIDNDERIEWFTNTDNFHELDPTLQIESDHIVLVPATCALAMLQAMSLQLNKRSLNAQQLALAEVIQSRLDQTTLLWDPH